MFRRTFNPEIFLTMLAILLGGMVPSVLVLMNHLDSNLLPGMLAGIGLYFLFFRKSNTERNEDKA